MSAFDPKRTSAEPAFAWVACPCAFHESLQRLEVTHHSRNKLRNRWMNVHRALHNRIGCFGVHEIDDAVDDLVACKSKQ